MVTIPPRHYCIIENPVVKDKDSRPVLDASGQVKLLHGDLEVRLSQDPFPLFPGTFYLLLLSRILTLSSSPPRLLRRSSRLRPLPRCIADPLTLTSLLTDPLSFLDLCSVCSRTVEGCLLDHLHH